MNAICKILGSWLVGVDARSGSPASAVCNKFRCKKRASGVVNVLIWTYTSCWVLTIGRQMWKTSVSGEHTSLQVPQLWRTRNHILVSASSALQFSSGLGCALVADNSHAWSRASPVKHPAKTTFWSPRKIFGACCIMDLPRCSTRFRLHSLHWRWSLHFWGISESSQKWAWWWSEASVPVSSLRLCSNDLGTKDACQDCQRLCALPWHLWQSGEEHIIWEGTVCIPS